MKSTEIAEMAKNYILLACNEQECKDIGLVYKNTYNGITENSFRLLNFYEPDLIEEAPYLHYAVCMEVDRILDNHKLRVQLGVNL